MRFITCAVVFLIMIETSNVSIGVEPATMPGKPDDAAVLLVKPIADDRELVVRRRDVPLADLPEVTRPAQPLPPETKLVVPSRLMQITVSLRSQSGEEIMLHTRLVQEYAPLQTGYEVIDLQLLDGAILILLSREPTPHLSLTIAHATSGHSSTALLSSMSWGSLVSAATHVDLKWIEARIIGSYADDTLGVSVRDRRGSHPDHAIQFRLNVKSHELEPAELPAR